MVRRVDADAVIVPGVRHFGFDVPSELVQVVDVVTVSPENTYARWAPGCSGGRAFSPTEFELWSKLRDSDAG
ncbi:hypothetical protein ACRS6B_10970 [Nocardia asteroides]